MPDYLRRVGRRVMQSFLPNPSPLRRINIKVHLFDFPKILGDIYFIYIKNGLCLFHHIFITVYRLYPYHFSSPLSIFSVLQRTLFIRHCSRMKQLSHKNNSSLSVSYDFACLRFKSFNEVKLKMTVYIFLFFIKDLFL